MATKVLSALVCAAALAGCAHHEYHRAPNPERPQVVFTNGYLVVNQEPVVVKRKPNEAAVVSWRLPPDGDLTFDTDGISILRRIKDGKMERVDDPRKPLIECRRGEVPPATRSAAQTAPKDNADNPRAFTCVVLPDAVPGLYVYEIHTRDRSGKRISADPTLMI